jgi:hypothetical protein
MAPIEVEDVELGSVTGAKTKLSPDQVFVAKSKALNEATAPVEEYVRISELSAEAAKIFENGRDFPET